MADRTLLLFTTSFPFGSITEATFVTAELTHLCRHFKRVIIIPENDKGSPADLSSIPNICVDTSRAHSIDHRHPLSKLRFALNPEVIRQGLKSLPHTPLRKWAAAWSMAINRYRITRNLNDIISRHNIDCGRDIFYTFWFDHVTEAIAMALPCGGGTLIAGAHGHDYMYTDTPTFRIAPFRILALERMKRLYVASHYGAELMRRTYPEFADKISARLLGSEKLFNGITPPSDRHNNGITILSCARMVPYKRVGLALSFIKRLSQTFPDKKFRYIHIGDGKLRQSIITEANNRCPSNLTIEFRGAIPNHEVQSIYNDLPVDWTILLSTHEGGNPIAISESLSYGVPVIACDVAGCNEIADNSVGLLLSANPTPEEFISRIQPYITGEKDQSPLRTAAYRRWADSFDASKLRDDFAKGLASL